MSLTILVVDDEEEERLLLEHFLTDEGYRVILASSGEEGLKRFREAAPNLVLLDIRLPGMDGIQVLEELTRLNNGCPVIMMTGYASVGSSVKAMRLGAEDYLIKPFRLDELKLSVERALEKPTPSPVRSSVSYRAEPISVKKESGFDNIIGDSSEMKSVLATVARIARIGSATVLIRGESGTGKELIARAIHFNGPRSDHPFVEVNCTAIPENLLEDELFGHEKGAYTDAKTERKGLFELANRGTLFLDEIGHVSNDLQVKLLHVLETQTFRRLGGSREVEVSTRIIAATNRDLEKALEDGSFRDDLYYRLNVVSVCLPPLRVRGDDIILIAKHYIDQHNREYGRNMRGLSPGAEALLRQYRWPGNVRELKNVIERAVLLASGDIIQPEDLSIDRRQKERRTQVVKSPVEIEPGGDIKVVFPPSGISLEDIERALIQEALKTSRWNTTRAAQLLHLSRDTLRYRMRKHGLDAKNGQAPGPTEFS